MERDIGDDDGVSGIVALTAPSCSPWWRVASELYVLPLLSLSAKIHDDASSASASVIAAAPAALASSKARGDLLAMGVLSGVNPTAA